MGLRNASLPVTFLDSEILLEVPDSLNKMIDGLIPIFSNMAHRDGHLRVKLSHNLSIKLDREGEGDRIRPAMG